MRRLLIATHGNFAEGIRETLQFILGECQSVNALCAYTEPDFDMEQKAHNIMNELHEGDELVVAVDVFGGSVANAFSKYIGQKQVYILCGVNFPMLVHLTTMLNEEKDTNKLISEALTAAKEGIINLNEIVNEAVEMEEEEF